ncbi:MAG: DUF3368 domain-containing protein [bacterium]
MPEVICNTSPLQYLHQIGQLQLLQALTGHILIPPAVSAELAEGHSRGVDLPDLAALLWVAIRTPISAPATSLIVDLGPGETQALMLALEIPGAIVVLDDARARRVAETRQIPFTGTLGILLDAKRAGFISTIKPSLEQLQLLRFRLATHTRAAVLKLAGESD